MSSLFRRKPETNPVPEVEFGSTDRALRTEISYEGQEFTCNVVRSADTTWVAAFGRNPDSDQRLFVIHDDEIVVARSVERPDSCVIANDGTVALVDAETVDTIGGLVYVIDADNDVLVRDRFESNVSSVSISSDGSYAAVTTLKPDRTVYLYDLRDETARMERGLDHGNYHDSTFDRVDDGWVLYVSRSDTDEPLCGFDTTGEIVWKSDYVTEREPFFKRLLSKLK